MRKAVLVSTIVALVVVLAYPAGVRANGPVPETLPGLEAIKADMEGGQEVGIALMVGGGALVIAGAFMIGEDPSGIRAAGAATTVSGVILGFGGYSLFRLSGHLADWLP